MKKNKFDHSNNLLRYDENGDKRCALCSEPMVEWDGKYIYHKFCKNLYQKAYKDKKLDLLRDLYKQKWVDIKNKYKNLKKCNTCFSIKNLLDFYKDSSSYDGYQNKCIDCTKEYNNSYNPYLLESNKKKLKEYKNRKDIKEKDKLLKKEKYNNDINYKIRSNVGIRINDMIKQTRVNKNNSTLYYLGCEIDFFKSYIETLFKPEMNWDNHGDIWELDHILPCSSFDFNEEENIFKCFHYTNYQPLFKTTKIAEDLGYKNEIGNRNKYNRI